MDQARQTADEVVWTEDGDRRVGACRPLGGNELQTKKGEDMCKWDK